METLRDAGRSLRCAVRRIVPDADGARCSLRFDALLDCRAICPCGCGREVVTKLSPARYRVIFDGEVSLKPSVAVTGLPCNSHYFITRGEVDWQRELDPGRAARVQALDQRAVEAQRASVPQPATPWWERLWCAVSGRSVRSNSSKPGR